MCKFIDAYEIEVDSREDNRKPFIEWMYGLNDKTACDKIWRRLNRIRLGDLGDHKVVVNGVWELRIYFGPGYRIYFAFIETNKVLIFCADTKATQTKDIEKTKLFYQDYNNREVNNG